MSGFCTLLEAEGVTGGDAWVTDGQPIWYGIQAMQSRMLTPDQYVRSVLKKYALPADHQRQVELVRQDLLPQIKEWAGQRLSSVQYSGSFAKGTVIKGGKNVDLFISLKPTTNDSLHDIYYNLFGWLSIRGFQPKRQNVSIGLVQRGLNVDLVPARRHTVTGQDHSLYRNKTDSWTKTNVHRHFQIVRDSGRTSEIKALKIWRRLHGLEFPSIYLELVAINALRRRGTFLSSNLVRLFQWLAGDFQKTTIVDPSNGENIISDDLTFIEKSEIARRAAWSLEQSWDRALW
jgi:hypothetical protein